MKPRDIIATDEAVAAATLIVQYCRNGDERTDCAECVFADMRRPYGDRCGLWNLPDKWELGMFRENNRRYLHD